MFLSKILLNVNSATSGNSGETEFVGGWVGDKLDGMADGIKEVITDVCTWLVETVFTILSPFVEWGMRSAIVACIVIYYCSHDKKAISKGMKYFFIYLIFIMLRGAIVA